MRAIATVWCMYVVTVDEQRAGIGRDALIEALRDMNIGTSVHYIPTHLFTAYRSLETPACEVTDRVWSTLLSLPLYPAMTDDDVRDVTGALASIVERAFVF